jgi:hypothetical protein
MGSNHSLLWRHKEGGVSEKETGVSEIIYSPAAVQIIVVNFTSLVQINFTQNPWK